MNYNSAQQRVKDLKSFYTNCFWFGIVAIIILCRRTIKHGSFAEAISTGSIILTIWGIILAVKAVKLFILNSDWENRIYEDELKKTKKPINF